MANKRTAVFGIYATEGQAERAVDSLVADHFSYEDISVLLPDRESSRDPNPIRWNQCLPRSMPMIWDWLVISSS